MAQKSIASKWDDAAELFGKFFVWGGIVASAIGTIVAIVGIYVMNTRMLHQDQASVDATSSKCVPVEKCTQTAGGSECEHEFKCTYALKGFGEVVRLQSDATLAPTLEVYYSDDKQNVSLEPMWSRRTGTVVFSFVLVVSAAVLALLIKYRNSPTLARLMVLGRLMD